MTEKEVKCPGGGDCDNCELSTHICEKCRFFAKTTEEGWGNYTCFGHCFNIDVAPDKGKRDKIFIVPGNYCGCSGFKPRRGEADG